MSYGLSMYDYSHGEVGSMESRDGRIREVVRLIIAQRRQALVQLSVPYAA